MLLIEKDQLEAYAAELKSIIGALTTIYSNADLNPEDGAFIYTILLALERLATKIENAEE